MIVEELNYLARGVEFHGHLGPYLVLGLKAGMAANQLLGKDPFTVRARVETETRPPKSCFVDGIQVVTGCSLGKGNIELIAGPSLKVRFTRNGKTLELELKPNIGERIRELPERDSRAQEDLALDLFRLDYEKLFNARSEGL